MSENNCTCPSDGLNDFDRGMLSAFEDGAVAEMGDTVAILGVTIPCVVSSRSVSQRNIQGGKSREVTATIEVSKADFVKTGANIYGGDAVIFSDGLQGKIQLIDDPTSQIYTIRIAPTLDGAAGPQAGKW